MRHGRLILSLGRAARLRMASEKVSSGALAAGAGAPAHHVPGGEGFRNPWPSFNQKQGLLVFGKLMLQDWNSKTAKVTTDMVKALQPVEPDLEKIIAPPNNKIQLTWIGHATYLMQMEGLTILTDPVWGDRCSPSKWFGPKRHVQPPLPLSKLPEVDVILISHNHYDHLDVDTIKTMGNKPLYLVPLGLKKFFTDLGISNVVELDWWQEKKLTSKGVEITATCTPAQHFSSRTAFDRNKTLWCSWVVRGPKRRVWFGGDTGYRSVPKERTTTSDPPHVQNEGLPVCPAFAEIGERYGPFDVALIPIGAYGPRWFMSAVHCSPEDAVAVHVDVKSKQSVAMHWGTFSLTDEPLLEPPVRLSKELQRLRIEPESFIALRHGETRQFV
ncbi:N-acyl-phosphatidylethanolamine-hydrolyzing phospholipase D [Klebsormidium nitens]|uniref:N-acyl-phosphatidylethanolamine-hydrolyzing phospholipase D n=1 Tax=Klebsormidium nitens TaxID=105231 RepID=A0A1Y1HTG3_KLENI|nr:N-acyl-phosphatidylethanolamine-hydrolyzing phospholipase D [Klebsormidium nitens]|eukprot:GAQ81915.1 N-acyl-phosphatidylethanolamine-hydrolyzing phospholipase D [Klebsormidium nitens]